MRTTRFRLLEQILAAIAMLGAANAGAAQLYDASLNTLPGGAGGQGWSSVIAAGVTSAVSAGIYALDTTGTALYQSGHFNFRTPGTLNTQRGFDLGIGLNVAGESHSAADNRAGFSLLFTGDDPTHSLELGFWTDSVWAYGITAGGTFVRGDAAPVATGGFHDYLVRVRNDGYQLYRDNALILSGALVDYTVNPVTLAIYGQRNMIFFGDDTTSAASSVQVKYVSLAPVPLPGALFVFAPALGALGALARRR